MLTAWQQFLQRPLTDAMRTMVEACASILGKQIEATARPKQRRSIVAKLNREHTRLSQMQDIVGCRLVVPGPGDQLSLLRALPSSGWQVVDRRVNPSHGYRAVHLIYDSSDGKVEVQVRTELQHMWALLSERLDHAVPGIKYGEGSTTMRNALESISSSIQRMENQELLLHSRREKVLQLLYEQSDLERQGVSISPLEQQDDLLNLETEISITQRELAESRENLVQVLRAGLEDVSDR